MADVESMQLVYEPAVIGMGEVRFVDRKRNINQQSNKTLLALVAEERHNIDWGSAEILALNLNDLVNEPEQVASEQGPFFAPVPAAVNSAKELKSLEKELSDWLYYNIHLKIKVHQELGLFQNPDETERAFKIRLQQAARERRDEEVDKLAAKYESRISSLETKLHKEERELAEDEAEYQGRKQEELIGIGESIFGFFSGRRKSTRVLSRAASKRRMTSQAKSDIEESQEVIAELKEDIAELEAELKESADEITRKWADLLGEMTEEELTPRRTDVNVRLVTLAWQPFWRITYSDGPGSRISSIPAYSIPN